MRRKNREVTDINEIKAIVDKLSVARLGMNDEGKVYIVPMNFGYEWREGRKLALYFHCAKVGRKIDILKKNNAVCLEMDGSHGLMEGDKACDYSYYFASLIGNGTVEFVEDTQEKIHGLSLIMKHMAGMEDANFEEKWVNAVCIFKVELTEYRVKQNQPARGQ